jgi:hypothetical protein
METIAVFSCVASFLPARGHSKRHRSESAASQSLSVVACHALSGNELATVVVRAADPVAELTQWPR